MSKDIADDFLAMRLREAAAGREHIEDCENVAWRAKRLCSGSLVQEWQ